MALTNEQIVRAVAARLAIVGGCAWDNCAADPIGDLNTVMIPIKAYDLGPDPTEPPVAKRRKADWKLKPYERTYGR